MTRESPLTLPSRTLLLRTERLSSPFVLHNRSSSASCAPCSPLLPVLSSHQVKKIAVDVSDLDWHISKNSSWLLYLYVEFSAQSERINHFADFPTFSHVCSSKPFVAGLLKKNIQHSLETQITSMLRDADLQLYGLQNRVIAATNARPSAAK